MGACKSVDLRAVDALADSAIPLPRFLQGACPVASCAVSHYAGSVRGAMSDQDRMVILPSFNGALLCAVFDGHVKPSGGHVAEAAGKAIPPLISFVCSRRPEPHVRLWRRIPPS